MNHQRVTQNDASRFHAATANFYVANISLTSARPLAYEGSSEQPKRLTV